MSEENNRNIQHLKIYRPDWNRQLYIDELADKPTGDLVLLAINRPLDEGKGESLAIPLDKKDLQQIVHFLTEILANAAYSDIPEKTNMQKVAVFDGGDSVCLFYEIVNENAEEDEIFIDWPKDWPETVNKAFLEAKGFKCVTA